MFTTFSALQIRILLLIAWLLIFSLQVQPFTLASEYGGFTFLGMLGAVFANATGAGGGVVFIPFFNQLAFSSETSIATSFAIQCCGMSAGALTWWAYYHANKQEQSEWSGMPKLLALLIPCSVFGLLSVQLNPDIFSHFADPNNLHLGFGLFSMLLALAIFMTLPYVSKQATASQFHAYDWWALAVIAVIGGGITAWLSIGVGELVAVYLIIRGFNVTFAIATAVILSAFTVWAGVGFHILVSQAVYWPVVLFAGAGAIIGGILAKHLVLYFSPRKLKIFFATWIFILGISAMPY